MVKTHCHFLIASKLSLYIFDWATRIYYEIMKIYLSSTQTLPCLRSLLRLQPASICRPHPLRTLQGIIDGGSMSL
jgi:hypothetical protein